MHYIFSVFIFFVLSCSCAAMHNSEEGQGGLFLHITTDNKENIINHLNNIINSDEYTAVEEKHSQSVVMNDFINYYCAQNFSINIEDIYDLVMIFITKNHKDLDTTSRQKIAHSFLIINKEYLIDTQNFFIENQPQHQNNNNQPSRNCCTCCIIF